MKVLWLPGFLVLTSFYSRSALEFCSLEAYNALLVDKLYLHAFVTGGTVSYGVLAMVLHAASNAFIVDYLGPYSFCPCF
ncbi:hypothetical protein A2U01_0026121 [Trifolium medium]|uniref:Uncharacterized protein n=1 Tax=Trifolium medium TaxID=97028 RepID=A0A392P019_9FABA|nr:hypothetical protein [Trifolium medium]